jgi:hypothetical protein
MIIMSRDKLMTGVMMIILTISYRWLYWGDTTSSTIELVSVTGDDRSTFQPDVLCPSAMSIDYAAHRLYWIDQCTYEIETLRLDGDSSTHSFPLNTIIFFAAGLTVYDGVFYWASSSGISGAAMVGDSSETQAIYTTSGTRATGIQVVHPSRQPGGKQATVLTQP